MKPLYILCVTNTVSGPVLFFFTFGVFDNKNHFIYFGYD